MKVKAQKKDKEEDIEKPTSSSELLRSNNNTITSDINIKDDKEMEKHIKKAKKWKRKITKKNLVNLKNVISKTDNNSNIVLSQFFNKWKKLKDRRIKAKKIY